MLDKLDKTFCLFAMQISSIMGNISIFASLKSGPIMLAKENLHLKIANDSRLILIIEIFTNYMSYFMLELGKFFLAQLSLQLVHLLEVFIMQTLIQSSAKQLRIKFHIRHPFLMLSLGKVNQNQRLFQRKRLLGFR